MEEEGFWWRRKVFGGGAGQCVHVCPAFPSELEEGRRVTWRVCRFFFFNL